MKRIVLLLMLTFSIVLMVTAATISSFQESSKGQKVSKESDSIEKMIVEGDALYAQREKLDNVKKAIDKYSAAFKLDTKNYDLMWRMSRAYYYYGAHVDEDDTDLKKELFDKGMKWGALTVKHYPNKYEGHFWYGVNCGSWGEANGVLKSLGMRHDVEREMLKVIDLGGERYEGAGAYRVLGRLEYRLPGLFGGDNDESIKYLKKSIELAPTHTMNYLFLAETLMEEDMYEEAKKYLEIMLKMPADPQWIPEAKEDKAKGRVLLTEVIEELED